MPRKNYLWKHVDKVSSSAVWQEGSYQKARLTKSNFDWNNYRAIKQEVRKQWKAARDTYVKDIVTVDQSKKLFTFVKSRKCDGSGVAPLKRDEVNHVKPATKAEILNDQFSSVFTKKDTSPLPDLD